MEHEIPPLPAGAETLTARTQAAKTDKRTLNTLLYDYMPFIKKCVSGVFFKGQSKADNLTDAMLAFVHSVQTYNPEYGGFIQYAAKVIRNRLIDNARQEIAERKRLFSWENQDLLWETDTALETYNRAQDEENLRLEIEGVNAEFAGWGFSWASLLKKSPKQERSRRICRRAALAVRESPDLLADALKNRRLPVSRLAERFPRKALETYRQYIAALIILSQGDYPYISSFIPHSGEEP